ncbi:MAG TPA: helix-turn-helix transcriptional regulator [Candidatus Izemoplasmatales bacterium]|nr:helix-turn-helix transcriptional regulator [Candidatus Izemoplasmatales bacterium]
MEDLKKIMAENLIELRRSKKWTQAEMAEKLNYTDKAISKWERAESMPDIEVLKQIADIFGVTLDFFVTKNAPQEQEKFLIPQKIRNNRIILTSMIVSVIWLLATIVFVYVSINSTANFWQVFLWAIPGSCLALLVMNGFWGKRKYVFYIMTLMIWSVITCFYVQFLEYNIWLIFLLGIPMQALAVLWSILKLK